MKRWKQEKGSITVFVLVAMLFFVMFLVGLFILSANAQSTQTVATKRIKEIYGQDGNQLEDVYQTAVQEDAKKQKVNVPKLTKGMTPVKWDGTNWIDTQESDTGWYNYSKKEWANVRLQDGSMFVWIPRYAYKIDTGWHMSQTGSISVEFLKDSSNIPYSGSAISIKGTSGQGNYLVSSGFYWDSNNNAKEDIGEALTGFWVAKYEASENSGKVQVKSGVSSWRNIEVSSAFTVCKDMNTQQNAITYGLSTDKTVVEPHLIKNTQWGCVSYLAMSLYGKNAEIGANTDISYLTGQGGNQASTTGNVTGVFDMSGGANEQVAAYVNTTSVQALASTHSMIGAESRYKDVYVASSDDTQNNNYEANKDKYGDAGYEVSANVQNANSLWHNGYLAYGYGTTASIFRGGYSNTNASIFTWYSAEITGTGTGNGFRPAMAVL